MTWRSDGHHPGLVLEVEEDDLDRVGSHWMEGRLKVGDVIMCLTHGGDCFFYYAILEGPVEYHPGNGKVVHDAYRLIEESKFGAYTLGKPFDMQPTTREFHMLMAGERSAMTASLRSELEKAGG